MSLIKLTQKPVIDFSKLVEKGKEVKAEIAKYNLDNVIATPETLTDLRALRAKLNKEKKEYEDSRKAVKKAVNEPYTKFEESYKENILTPYDDAENILKGHIDTISEKLVSEKTQKFEDYFNSINTFDFIEFKNVGLSVTMSASEKGLKEKIDDFMEAVKNDVSLIEGLPNSERVLAKYEKYLDIHKSVEEVNDEIAREEAIKARTTSEVVRDMRDKGEIMRDVRDRTEVVSNDSEKLFTTEFKVRGTRSQLVELKQYMTAKGIEIL